MVVPTRSPITEQELHTVDGQVYAYIVPVEQLNHLRGEIASLREQLAVAVRQRDHHLAKLQEVLKTYFPPPPTEEELLAATPNSAEVRKLIEDLESR